MGNMQGCITKPPQFCNDAFIQKWRSDFALVNTFGIVLSLISIIACLFIFGTYACLKIWKIPSFLIILLLIFSDFAYAIGSLIMWTNTDYLYEKKRCLTQSFLQQWSNISQICWTTVMAVILFSENKQKLLSREIFSTRRQIIYVTIGVVFPLILSLIPFYKGYSPDEDLCWITQKSSAALCNPKYFQNYGDYCPSIHYFYLIFLYSVVWLSIIINLVLYTVVIYARSSSYDSIKQTVISSQQQEEVQSFHLLIFPVAQLIIWIFPTLHRIMDFIDRDFGEPMLSILHFSSLSISGFVNCLIYGFNPLVRYRLKMKFCRRKQIAPVVFYDQMHVNASGIRDFDSV